MNLEKMGNAGNETHIYFGSKGPPHPNFHGREAALYSVVTLRLQ